jgi:hypothetical protein
MQSLVLESKDKSFLERENNVYDYFSHANRVEISLV